MKFVIATIDMAKKAAKSLRREMGKAGHDVPLHEAQRLVAALYGYGDWHALELSAGKGMPSPVDCSLAVGQLHARLKRQLAVLQAAGIEPETAELILAKVQPTGPRIPAGTKPKGPGGRQETESGEVGPGPIHPGAVVPAAFGLAARVEFYQTALSLLNTGYHLDRCLDLMEKVYSRRSDMASEVATVVLRTLRAIRECQPDPFYDVHVGDDRGLGEVMLGIGVELSVLEEGILLALKDGGIDYARAFRGLVDGATTLRSVEEQYAMSPARLPETALPVAKSMTRRS